MKNYQISMMENISINSHEARIGGMSLLPKEIAWPINPNGEKLVLIASIPCDLINRLLDINYPPSLYFSIFTTYNEDYFLDVITYSGDEEDLYNIKNGYTKVLCHYRGEERNEAKYIIPAKKMAIAEETTCEEEFYGSKIGSTPGLLQNKKLSIDGMMFCLQLYSADFPKDFENIFFLSDAIGYLYIKTQYAMDNTGLFFVQTS